MKKTILFALCALILAAMLVSCGGKEPYMIQTLTYPENTVKTLEERGLTPESFAAFAAGNTSYQGNAGREALDQLICLQEADMAEKAWEIRQNGSNLQLSGNSFPGFGRNKR